MRQALVQHAEHDIDRDQRRQDQQRLRADAVRWKALHVAGEVGADDVGHVHFRHRLLDGGGRLLERHAGRQIVGDGHRGELALVVDDQRRDAALDMRDRGERHLACRRAPGT